MTHPRLLLADDHRIVVEGLRSILIPEYELVGIVEDGRELVDAAKRLKPDVIVADIAMPRLNGLDAVAQLRKEGCPAKVVFLTMHKDATYAAKALEMGASGYVLKHSASTELLMAIRAALSGGTYVTSEIAESMRRAAETRTASLEAPALTPRQREVLQLFAEGRSAKEVATVLHISTRTAENHKARIMDVLCISTTADLVQYALRHGIIATD
ncbi:Transcriptional regulatory protein DegU [Anatilimnocola aggregata]|uniref:Transcriptional regulatory protein DegU n=1 Tax=Anatilimnocola aggregata TaxID=2528021 RepID=A0A517YFG1_9BACT|nr:response regulator transcription factor [Anatilimnocola aggregata]QDU28968.1 Transcriptional regulatory protein DegU [Anatilimnocola aggregata]